MNRNLLNLLLLLSAIALIVVLGPPRLMPGDFTPQVAVLYSVMDSVSARPSCPDGACRYVALEPFRCGEYIEPASIVIVTGHSEPPAYLGSDPIRLADVIHCLSPRLVVLDTDYGFSEPLLSALESAGVGATVVGPTFKLPAAGLLFEADFFKPGPIEAALARVRSRSSQPLKVWRGDLSPGLALTPAKPHRS